MPPEFSTFFRALVTLEGTLTMLSPGYLVIEAAEQLAAEWAKASLAPGSVEELVRRELASLALLLRRGPSGCVLATVSGARLRLRAARVLGGGWGAVLR